MKHIGKTDTHDHMVEFSEEEYHLLSALALIVEGRSTWDLKRMGVYTQEIDLAPIFGVIEKFVETREHLDRALEEMERFKKLWDAEEKDEGPQSECPRI